MLFFAPTALLKFLRRVMAGVPEVVDLQQARRQGEPPGPAGAGEQLGPAGLLERAGEPGVAWRCLDQAGPARRILPRQRRLPQRPEARGRVQAPLPDDLRRRGAGPEPIEQPRRGRR